jgi:hypothetical protein
MRGDASPDRGNGRKVVAQAHFLLSVKSRSLAELSECRERLLGTAMLRSLEDIGNTEPDPSRVTAITSELLLDHIPRATVEAVEDLDTHVRDGWPELSDPEWRDVVIASALDEVPTLLSPTAHGLASAVTRAMKHIDSVLQSPIALAQLQQRRLRSRDVPTTGAASFHGLLSIEDDGELRSDRSLAEPSFEDAVDDRLLAEYWEERAREMFHDKDLEVFESILEGTEQSEAADELGITAASYRQRRHRVLKALRRRARPAS